MNILIVRLSSLGDIVHTLPAAAALRRAFPAARIDWLVDARYRAILDLVPTIDQRLVIGRPRASNGVHGGVEQVFEGWNRLWDAVLELRRRRYDLAFDFQSLLKSAILARSSGAGRVIGFATPDLRERGARLFYTVTQPTTGASHVVDKSLALLQAAGITDTRREFPIEAAASPVVGRVREALGIGAADRFALINPGAGWPNKRWPPERFGAVAAALRDRHGLRTAVLWGPGEQRLAAEVAEASDGAAAMTPPTTIRDVVALCGAAVLMISGDTGPMHVAAALGVPIVGIYGPSDPTRNGPWLPTDVAISRFHACVCRYRRRCRQAAACIADITVEEVTHAVGARLAAAGGAAGRA